MKTARTLAAIAAMATGLGLLAAPALATEDDKPAICHPVGGEGETGNGWNIIEPSKASAHIDEETGKGKHEHDGRTDVYQVDGLCPGQEPRPTETATASTTTATSTSTATATSTSTTTAPPETETAPPTSSTTTTTTAPPTTESPTTDPTRPTKPEDDVFVYEESILDCDERQVIHYTAIYTTEYVWDGEDWVLAPEPKDVEESWEYEQASAEQCPVTQQPTTSTTTTAPVAVVKPSTSRSATVAVDEPQSPAPAPSAPVLAQTGSDTVTYTVAGLVLLALGVVLLGLGRVRVERQH